MPEHGLLEAYLDRLGGALPLPEAERASAVEEIAAHVSMASEALIERGVPREVAERRILERLGAPERLAHDIAVSHRLPGHVLSAAGVAVRVTVVTAIQAFVIAWAGVFVIALALGLGVAGLRRLVGPEFLVTDWSPMLDGLLPAVVGGLAAYAVGRAVVGPVALAARRQPADVRLPLLVIGTVVAAVIGLTAIEARWTLGTAAVMTTMPAWFALGILRPNLVPRWNLRRASVLALVVILIVGSGLAVFLGGAVGGGSTGVASEARDMSQEYASVGPFVSLENPPVMLDEAPSTSGTTHGPGPVTVSRSGTISTDAIDDWTGLRLELWPGPMGELNGSALDPTATEPVATAPMVIEGRRIEGQLTFAPVPDRHLYYVAVTGVNAAGERWQLTWPGIESWQWRGTPLERFLAIWR